MELRTEAVDRVLEALSPALAAELERVTEETRQRLETEFQGRLQAAIRDAEEAARITAEGERQHAVDSAVNETRTAVREQVTAELEDEFQRRLDETREAARRQVTEELQRDFDRRLQEVTDQATANQASLQQSQADWAKERTHLEQQIEQWRVFADSQRQLNEASSQPEILLRWLNLAETFAPSVAVYTTKSDALSLWKSRGGGAFPPVISFDTNGNESYFKPVVIRGKTVAAVSAVPPFRAEALDFLTATLERAIELFGFRLRNK